MPTFSRSSSSLMSVTSLVITLAVTLSSSLISTVYAADANQVPPPPPEPSLSPNDSRNQPEPEVTIIQREDAVVEEVRINGRLRYAKVTPTSGPAYYFIDTDGDGVLDTKEHNLDNPPINQWILFRW